METPPALSSAEDSGYEPSTGPTTPDNSPLFLPSLAKALSGEPLSRVISDVEVSKLALKVSSAMSICHTVRHPIRNVCFIGAGYVGTPTAAVTALQNPHVNVNVLDRDQNRIRKWQSSHLPIYEPGLDAVVRAVRDGVIQPCDEKYTADPHPTEPNLFFTTDSRGAISQADIIFLAVNTPTKTFGQGSGRATHMAAVDGATKDVASFARSGAIIVEKSTVPCGTAKRIRQMLQRLRPEAAFEVLSNPEFLSEGCAIQNLLHPDRILIGSAKTLAGTAAARALAGLFASWVPDSKIVFTNTWSSELAKLVANAMLAQRISSINSISAICEETGADISEVASAIGRDPRIGPKFLKAGLGFGGSCFRKDIASLTYLAESLGLDDVADYWRSVNHMNELQRQRFVQRVIRSLDENLQGKKIALLGFSFKKDTGDTRESLAIDIIQQLQEERPGQIAIYDPCCSEVDIRRELDLSLPEPTKGESSNVIVCNNVYEACEDADAILIINDSDEFMCKPSTRTSTPQPSPLPITTTPDELQLPNRGILHLKPRPACELDCELCRTDVSERGRHESAEWARIAEIMNEPKLVFDGRCILDAGIMERMGIRLESIGSRSEWKA